MLSIRLKREGLAGMPVYKIIVSGYGSRVPLDYIGTYIAHGSNKKLQQKATFIVNKKKLVRWLSFGAVVKNKRLKMLLPCFL